MSVREWRIQGVVIWWLYLFVGHFFLVLVCLFDRLWYVELVSRQLRILEKHSYGSWYIFYYT